MPSNQSTGSLAVEIQARLQDVPTTLNTGSITNILNFEKIYLQNFTGETIDSAGVPEKYQNMLIHLGCAQILANKVGIGVDFDVQLGEFSISKGGAQNLDVNQLNFHLQMANMDLKNLTHKGLIKVYGV
jgi:hypothetical protein